MPRGSALFSLQAKLIAAFVVVVLVALVLAGGIFVATRRDEQERQALDHAFAASPAIYGEFIFREIQGLPVETLAEFSSAAADEYDVHLLLVNSTTGEIAFDSNERLTGKELALPQDVDVAANPLLPSRPYVSWRPAADTPGDDLVLVTTGRGGLERFRGFPRRAEPYSLILAVPEGTVTRAWLSLVPSLGIAAAIALPVAVLLALLIARYVTLPLQQLTLASQRMAEGSYDVSVSVDRDDEVGRLAQAFSTMARRVGEAHGQMRALVANVSQDLKTPLTSIIGFAQALRDGGAQDEAEVRRMGAVIHEEAQRLSARLNDLLYLSELESGQTLLQRDEIDLRRLLETAVDRIEPDATARGVRLAVDVPEGVSVSADGAKLERAFENLLDNARKYTPDRGWIRVRATPQNGASGGVAVEVANTADVSPEEVPRLFERFYRRERSRAQAGGASGSGLGLPIARDLIELHGGTLDASARDGEIVFTAKLPGGA